MKAGELPSADLGLSSCHCFAAHQGRSGWAGVMEQSMDFSSSREAAEESAGKLTLLQKEAVEISAGAACDVQKEPKISLLIMEYSCAF
uniref:Uncharacterized protein n=1 Tax=Sphaerodactylus townsendi TaxID=933632 RepID=A0ACB8F370_9SAUR